MNNLYTKTINSMRPWFHNLHLPDGSQTAPDHFLGDFPKFKWDQIKNEIPDDLNGCEVLDIGCNAGFYSIEMAKRGAKVTGIDLDPHYLEQAEWAVSVFNLRNKIEIKQMQVYDLLRFPKHFDIIIFMGVLYHLRYPILALDIVAEKTKDLMIFQTLTFPGISRKVTDDLKMEEREKMTDESWPKMAFIEHKFAGDPTNWWAMNDSAVISILRSCGIKVIKRPGHEIYICRHDAAGCSESWNRSEFLSAAGIDWKNEVKLKLGR